MTNLFKDVLEQKKHYLKSVLDRLASQIEPLEAEYKVNKIMLESLCSINFDKTKANKTIKYVNPDSILGRIALYMQSKGEGNVFSLDRLSKELGIYYGSVGASMSEGVNSFDLFIRTSPGSYKLKSNIIIKPKQGIENENR